MKLVRFIGFTAVVILFVIWTDFGGEVKANTEAMLWGVSPEDLRKSVVIMGEQFDCAEVVGEGAEECDWQMKPAFVRWGDNLDAYISSERLGPFGNDIKSLNHPQGQLTFREVAVIGLSACRIMASNGSQDEFVDWAHDRYRTQDRSVFTPMWTAAQEILCSDTVGVDGYRSPYMWLG